MKQKTTLWRLATLLLLFVGLASCVPSSDVDDVSNPFADTKFDDVVIGATGGDRTISVPISRDWTYFCNAEGDWIKLSRKDGELILTIDANTQGQERSAAIIVFSGKHQTRFNVVQGAADFVMLFSTDEVEFASTANLKVIHVRSNAGSWKLLAVPAEATWLSVTGRDGGDVLVLEVEENGDYTARQTDLTFEAPSGEVKSLTIKQSGKAKYYLPYDPDNNYSAPQMIAFELNRGNVMVAHSEPTVNFGSAQDGMTSFLTASKYMPEIVYKRAIGDIKYTSAVMLIKLEDIASPTHPELEEYNAMLKAADYIDVSDQIEVGNTTLMIRKDSRMAVMIQVKNDVGGALVVFTPLYPQETDYATFDAIPYGPTDFLKFLSSTDLKVAQVEAFEAALNSKLVLDAKDDFDDKIIKLQIYATGNHGQQEAFRGYFYYTSTDRITADMPKWQAVSYARLYFDQPTLGVWNAGSRIFVTREMGKLLSDAGFESLGEKNGVHLYARLLTPGDTKNYLIYSLTLKRYSDLYNSNPLLEIMLYTISEDEGSTSSATNPVVNPVALATHYLNNGKVLSASSQRLADRALAVYRAIARK